MHGSDSPPNTYQSTKKRAVVTLAFTAPATVATGGGSVGGGFPSSSGGGSSFVGSGTVGTVTPGGTTTTTTTTTTGGGPTGTAPTTIVSQASSPVPPVKVPGIVWLLVPLGLLGLWAVRQAVMEPADGMRRDGVIAAIRQRNAAAKGIPVSEREDTMTQARAATRRARSALRRSFRRK